ncbi:hypothetical protein G9A89_002792 [Geosiphon pyriformis]|nr:hypothetical protein G9A89_002792 [Geosiphon pyriformis]
MNPIGSSAGGLASGLAGVRTQSGTKKKTCIKNVYAHSPSYKKVKKPNDSGVVVNLLAGSLAVNILHGSVDNRKKSWSSKMDSEESSVGGTSDIENMKNTIVEEMSYVNSDTSGDDELMNNATPKNLRMKTYIFEHLSKQPSFINIGGADNILELPLCTFNGSIQLLPVVSYDREIRSFILVKFFALDIELSAVSGKTVSDKLIYVKKIFYQVDGFGGASILSKFSGIIRSSFTSEMSLNKAKELAINKNILSKHPFGLSSNSQGNFYRSSKITIIKFELAEVACLVAFKWSVLVEKNSVQVALAVGDKQTWVLKDYHWALLYTLPIGMTAYDLADLLESYGGKTCFIGCNSGLYVCNRCAIICFKNKTSKLATFGLVPVFKEVSLRWAGLSLAYCATCKQYDHTSGEYLVGRNFGGHGKKVVTDLDCVYLASIYKKKQALITCPVSFGSKTWASVVGAPPVHSLHGAGLLLGSNKVGKPLPPVASDLEKCLVNIESSFISLTEQIGELAKRLESLMPAVAQPSPECQLPENIVMGVSLGESTSDKTVTVSATIKDSSASFHVVKLENMLEGLAASVLSLSAYFDSLVLAGGIATCNIRRMNNSTKQNDVIHWHKNMDNLISIFTESKLKRKVCPWLTNKFDSVWVFTTGLDFGHLGAGVVIVMNSSLARHVCKAGKINSLIAKAVNKSSFVVFCGDFNEDGSRKCTSFKKCMDLGLVNSLAGCPVAKMPMWANSSDIMKIIDYVFVFPNLVGALVHCGVLDVGKFFDTDHKAVSLGFRNAMAANASMILDVFGVAVRFSDLDAMWDIVHKIMVLSAEGTFKQASTTLKKRDQKPPVTTFMKSWFKDFDVVFTKELSRSHKLEMLVSKLVKASHLVSSDDFASLLEVWNRLDVTGASIVKSLFLGSSGFNVICSALAKAKKTYHASKLLESKRAEDSCIKLVISKRMESFELDKSYTIRSVLECSFHKVVLDHLVIDDELILESGLVKSGVDVIMERWTRKHEVVSDISDKWAHQYQPLDYVFDGAFSGVMCSINFNEMFAIVMDLPDGKAVSLSGISNKLWKHCNKSVLDMLLVLLNACLVSELVSGPWREAWMSMIPKPYEWEGVLTNTHPIALIETAHKILSKVLSDRISLACIFIFAVGAVVEDALEKNKELWLVLQNMHKAYNSVGWEHLRRSLIRIKMYNRIMTNFGLTDGYHVHDELDQSKVFSSLLWCIFYDLLLCEVKRQESAGLTSFFAAGAFVDNTIWVGSSQAATQHILDVASEFFRFNDIAVNNDKMVAIFINCQITNSYLTISELSISIAKKRESHCYLGIFLLTKGLLKSSLVKAYSNKTISNKQFAYLVSADALICKGLKSKSGLSLNFSSNILHHLSLYAESKSASIIFFANSVGILDHLFSHRSYDLQFLVHIGVSFSNNFLAGVVCVFNGCNLSLSNSLASVFYFRGSTLMSLVLGEPRFHKCVSIFRHYGIAFVKQLRDWNGVNFNWKTFKRWKQLDPRSPVPAWFEASACFLDGVVPFLDDSPLRTICTSSGILQSYEFGVISDSLLHMVLSGLGTVDMKADAAAYFEDVNLGLGVEVSGLVSSMMAELQAIALALECVPSFHLIDLFLDSQTALDAYRSEFLLLGPDFKNHCWIECHHIVNVICWKNLWINWVKVRGHSGVLGNECANMFAKAAASSGWHLPHLISEQFLKAGDIAISGNSRHFVHDVFHSIHHACWEVGSGFCVMAASLYADINWPRLLLVWHLDFHLAAGFTTLHHQLLVAVCKHLYSRLYPSMVCLFYGDVEVSDHVFFCLFDAADCVRLIDTHASAWEMCSGLSHFSLCVSQLLFDCAVNMDTCAALCKDFVFSRWFDESVSVFKDPKVVSLNIVNFVRKLCIAFREGFWLVWAKHWAFMEKNGLIPRDGFILILISGLLSMLLAGVVRLLGIINAYGISFELHKFRQFLLGISNVVSVYIGE